MLLSMLGTVFHNNLENKENKSREFSSCEKHGDLEKYLPTSWGTLPASRRIQILCVFEIS
jgi:hypothetical protein